MEEENKTIDPSEVKQIVETGGSEDFGVPVQCRICGEKYMFIMDKEKFYKLTQTHELIQNIFPDLDRGWRELLISGTCPDCWDRIFCISFNHGHKNN